MNKETPIPLLAQRACATLAGVGLGGLSLSHTLGEDLGVLILEALLSASLRLGDIESVME